MLALNRLLGSALGKRGLLGSGLALASGSGGAARCSVPATTTSSRGKSTSKEAAGGGGAEDEFYQFRDQKIPYIQDLHIRDPSEVTSLPCFRVLDDRGKLISGCEKFELEKDLSKDMYRTMVRLQTLDTLFYEAQRQGRFSFYMTCFGEEATVIGSAAALETADHVFAQYREHGLLLWRGQTFQEFADQCYGNNRDFGKGRQMPIHYGRKDLNVHTISSPLTTQLPQAAGAAYANKLNGYDGITVAYFGEGAASEGDFHAAMNFASTLACPVLFFCRNNGWAISTPSDEQYTGDGIAGRGSAYGMPALRVDGMDAIAMYHATKTAREYIMEHKSPVLIEAMSYRSSHHSTSDDSSRYREISEMQAWKARDPVARFQIWLEDKGWWSDEEETEVRGEARKEVMKVLDAAERENKLPLREMVTDVYDEVPQHLEKQYQEIKKFAQENKHLFPNNVPIE
uniref:2-oxoisovalerate dehydrogenase subunit alpha n=1 Tax=Phaeocystis cordata TaxID=118079 RepID=A0A6T5VMK1_9EUKA|mmetsp:Transcript_5360/g.13818  ORF Transcript_5360/g.13818 Transcript_5360/m.13818 type:complete len:456 (-) Transcript_5360:1228-2595(-)